MLKSEEFIGPVTELIYWTMVVPFLDRISPPVKPDEKLYWTEE